MSHGHERAEKVCLNCGANLHGRYCHVCGQENVEPTETTGQLIRHFFEDMTHFDGKFFSTIKVLIAKPGMLPQEYLAGHRARYLHPVRMYMFISFVFFIILFTFFSSNTVKVVPEDNVAAAIDSSRAKNIRTNLAPGNEKKGQARKHKSIPTAAEYEVQQSKLPEEKKDGKYLHNFYKKMFTAIEEVRKEDSGLEEKIGEKFMHSLPQMFFVLLPLFAVLLYLLYIRQRHSYNYVAHAIFTVHYYCFVFFAWFMAMLLNLVPAVGSALVPIMILSMYFYLYKAMRKFYKQGRWKTIAKFIIFNSIFLVLMAVTSLVYLLISALAVA